MLKKQIKNQKPPQSLPEINIDSNLLSAKLGNKEAFTRLWELYKPIIIRNADRFCSIAKGFEQYRPAIVYDSYVYFWDIINKYEFGSDIPFSYYVSDQLLKKTGDKIRGNRTLPAELIDEEALRGHPGYRSVVNRAKLNDLRTVMKRLSPKQLQAVYLFHYVGFNQVESAHKVGISQVGLRKRIKQSHTKIKKFLRKMAWDRLSKKEKRAIRKLRRMANVTKKI